jgi:hypothetical protein
MIPYILIFTIYTTSGGMVSSTAEFNSGSTCLKAADKIVAKYENKANYSSSVWSVCVKK